MAISPLIQVQSSNWWDQNFEVKSCHTAKYRAKTNFPPEINTKEGKKNTTLSKIIPDDIPRNNIYWSIASSMPASNQKIPFPHPKQRTDLPTFHILQDHAEFIFTGNNMLSMC